MSTLPPTEWIGRAATIKGLATLLDKVVPSGEFTHDDRVFGGSRPGRALFTTRPPESFTIVDGIPRYNAMDMARDLLDKDTLIETRLGPPSEPDAKKGWEVHRAQYDDQTFVVVYAVWVSPPA